VDTLLRFTLIGALTLASSCNRPADDRSNTIDTGGAKPGANVSTPVGVAELKPSECEELGGTIKYDSGCDDYKLACRVETTGGTRQTCIDELDTAPE